MQYYAERNNIWISLFTEWELFRTPKTSTHSTAPMLLTLTFISPEEFSAENGFISFSKCFFIVFPNSLFCVIFQIFLRPPIGTKTDSECSAGRDLFHVFLKYSCFPKKAAAAAIFNYLKKILQQKHTVLEEADDTKCLCWKLFFEIFLMTQLLCKKNLHILLSISIY